MSPKNPTRALQLICILAAMLCTSSAMLAQEISTQQATTQQATPVIFTTQQDHQQMLEQLGISKLRPGRSSDEKSPNVANYDEEKANPYPALPALLRLNSGEQVIAPEQWWGQRRLEILELLEREVYGRVPMNVPSVKWELRETRSIEVGGQAAIQQHIVGVVDNTACPDIQVNISMALTLPRDTVGPVPVLMNFGWTPFEPSPFNFRGRGGRGGRGGEIGSEAARPKPVTREDRLIAAGWGCATVNPSSIQADSGGFQRNPFAANADADAAPTGAGLTRGIIGLTNLGQPRKPDDWGALRAWGWGASRALDFLESVPQVDAKKVGISGVSRYGKGALVAMAFDERFAMGLIASSGAGGTKVFRRNFGESLENLAGSGAYHWMAGNYMRYSAEDATFGVRTAADLPVDAHMTLALCAPRLTFISHGIPERGDAHWLDHQGSFMAAIAAQPAFRLLGAKTLGRSDDFQSEKMPEVNVELLDGQLAWRQHDGGHTDEPYIVHFVKWADRWFERPAANYEFSYLEIPAAQPPVTRLTTPRGADIPEAVRIKRPTTEEMSLAQKALADFIAASGPDTQKILTEFPTLLEVRPPRANSAVVPNLSQFFQQKHQANIAVAKQGETDVLFLGDSITDFWRNEDGPFAGKQVFDEHFGDWKVANFGIAGDTTQGVLYRLAHGEGEGFQPKVVMLMIGTNNTSANTAAEIAEGIGAVVLELQQRFAQTKILLLGIFPRGAAGDPVRGQIKEINHIISNLDDGDRVHYLEIGDIFLNEAGAIPTEIMVDALHPSARGYELWAKAVHDKLDALRKP